MYFSFIQNSSFTRFILTVMVIKILLEVSYPFCSISKNVQHLLLVVSWTISHRISQPLRWTVLAAVLHQSDLSKFYNLYTRQILWALKYQKLRHTVVLIFKFESLATIKNDSRSWPKLGFELPEIKTCHHFSHQTNKFL